MNNNRVTYNLSTDEEGQSILTVIVNDNIKTITSEHPNFREINEYLRDCVIERSNPEASRVEELLNIAAQVGTRLEALSDRVRLQGNTLYFDNDRVEGPLVDHIMRLLREEDNGTTEDWRSWVKFLENLANNPSQSSRESLFEFLQRYGLTVTTDGHFIAYKGVTVGADDEMLSINSGKAVVNGKVVRGQIPNPVGSVIEMPRSEVQHDTTIGCSTGLHAGAWDYASTFGRGKILIVKINPRDVVAVPDDSVYQKLRVTRYEVISVTDAPYSGVTYHEEDPCCDGCDGCDGCDDAEDCGCGCNQDCYSRPECEICLDVVDEIEIVESPEGDDICKDCYDLIEAETAAEEAAEAAEAEREEEGEEGEEGEEDRNTFVPYRF